MKKTNIRVDFRIVGDTFNPDIITKKLMIEPSISGKKGDMVKIGDNNIIKKFSEWYISTGYEESLDSSEQLNKILKLIQGKKSELIEIKKQYELDYVFDFVIKIENGQTPGLHLCNEEIEFANEIGAEFDFDLYVYS